MILAEQVAASLIGWGGRHLYEVDLLAVVPGLGSVKIGRPAVVGSGVVDAIAGIESPDPHQQIDLGRTTIQFDANSYFDRSKGVSRWQGVLRTFRGKAAPVKERELTRVA